MFLPYLVSYKTGYDGLICCILDEGCDCTRSGPPRSAFSDVLFCVTLEGLQVLLCTGFLKSRWLTDNLPHLFFNSSTIFFSLPILGARVHLSKASKRRITNRLPAPFPPLLTHSTFSACQSDSALYSIKWIFSPLRFFIIRIRVLFG